MREASARHRTLAMLGSTNAADGAMALAYLMAVPRLVRGEAIEQYERGFRERIGTRHSVSFGGARVGFYGTLGALGIGPGDEVMLQVPTHAVVVNAIRYRGATPVFVDCEPRTVNIDFDAAERLLSPRTRAFLVQHTFGVPADLDRAVELAERHGIALIEDCVHSLGATFRNRPIGSFGRAAFFSTEESKTISTTVGGMVMTDDDALAASLEDFQRSCEYPPARIVAAFLAKYLAYGMLTQPVLHHYAHRLYERTGRHHPFPHPSGMTEWQGLRPPNYERRLSNAQARLGLRALARLDANIAHRREIAAIYASRLPGRGGLEPGDERMQPVYVRYPVVVTDREAALEALRPRLVGDSWFDQVVQAAVSVETFGYVPGSCPCAEHLTEHLVNLPTHLHVRPDDAEALVDVITPFLAPTGEHG